MWSRIKSPAVFLALVFTLMACSSPTQPAPKEYGAVAIPATQQYRRWWADLEQCSGLRGNIDAVQFYGVDSLNNHAVGRTFTDGPRVYLVSLFASDSLVVSHEMMHALLQRTGHPVHYFNGVCGDLLADGES